MSVGDMNQNELNESLDCQSFKLLISSWLKSTLQQNIISVHGHTVPYQPAHEDSPDVSRRQPPHHRTRVLLPVVQHLAHLHSQHSQ